MSDTLTELEVKLDDELEAVGQAIEDCEGYLSTQRKLLKQAEAIIGDPSGRSELMEWTDKRETYEFNIDESESELKMLKARREILREDLDSLNDGYQSQSEMDADENRYMDRQR